MNRNTLLLFFAAIAIGSTMAVSPADQSFRLDGVITENEWRDAKAHELAGGGKLMVKRENDDLYLALVARREAWAHVYLSYGDTVSVLHASAALGEAKYVRQNNFWQPVQSFQWKLRDHVYNNELEKKQQDHYRRFGWVANNNNMGDGKVFEFRLDLSRLDDKPFPFACVVAEVPEEFHYFPITLKDDTILKKLVQGYAPDSVQFDPPSWQRLQ